MNIFAWLSPRSPPTFIILVYTSVWLSSAELRNQQADTTTTTVLLLLLLLLLLPIASPPDRPLLPFVFPELHRYIELATLPRCDATSTKHTTKISVNDYTNNGTAPPTNNERCNTKISVKAKHTRRIPKNKNKRRRRRRRATANDQPRPVQQQQ